MPTTESSQTPRQRADAASRRRRWVLWQVAIFLLLCGNIEAFCRWRLVAEGYETGTPVATLDPRRGWRLQARTDEINEDGLRNPPVEPPVPGEVRVLCLGGSVTQGLALPVSETFEVELEKRLRAVVPEGTRVTVINGGVARYNSYNYTRLLYEVGERYQPQIVIVMGGWNEVGEATPVSPADVYGFHPSTPVRTLLYRSATYRYLAHKLLDTKTQRLDDYLPTMRNLQLVQSFVKEHGARLAVVFEAHRSPPWIADMHRRHPDFTVIGRQNETTLTQVRDAFRQASDEMGVPFLDMNAVFERSMKRGLTEDDLFRENDPVHLTAQGNAQVARALLQTLVRLRWVPTRE